MKKSLELVVAVLLTSAICASAGYVKNRYQGSLNTKCQYDDDCQATNAYCKSQRTCACRIDYTYDASLDACIATKIGHKCEYDDDCDRVTNTQCRDGVCKCRLGHVQPTDPSSGCLPSSRLMANCVDNAQCNATEANSQCNPTTRKCECKFGYHEDPDTSACINTKRIGDNCSNDKDCGTEGFTCQYSSGIRKCACSNGYQKDGNKCTRAAGGTGSALMAISSGSLFVIIALLKYF